MANATVTPSTTVATDVKKAFHFSMPTQAQVIASVERIVVVFVVAFFTTWIAVPDKFTKAAVIAGVGAGVTAVYQAVKSLTTSL